MYNFVGRFLSQLDDLNCDLNLSFCTIRIIFDRLLERVALSGSLSIVI